MITRNYWRTSKWWLERRSECCDRVAQRSGGTGRMAMKLSLLQTYLFTPTFQAILTNRVSQVDLIFGFWSEFVSRSVHARLHVSMCSGYGLCQLDNTQTDRHTQTHRQTQRHHFVQFIRRAQPAGLMNEHSNFLSVLCVLHFVTFTARRRYASAVLGVVIMSVCLSVCHTRALWQNQTMHCGYFDTARKAHHSSFLTPTVVGGRRPLPSEICAQSDQPLRKTPTSTDFRL